MSKQNRKIGSMTFEYTVKKCGTSSHVILPASMVGKRVKVTVETLWLVIPSYQRVLNYQSLDVALYMQRLLTTPIISFRKKLIFLEQIPSRYYSRYRKYLEPPPRIRNQLIVRTIDIAWLYILCCWHTQIHYFVIDI